METPEENQLEPVAGSSPVPCCAFLPDVKAGDNGQRYEIWCDDGDGMPLRMGWANSPDALREAVELHPSWSNHRVIDRHNAEVCHGTTNQSP